MEIRQTIPTSLPANETAASTIPPPGNPRQNEAPKINPPRESQGENRESGNRQEAEKPKIQEAEKPRIPIATGTRVELRVDEGTHEVFGRVINVETGEAIREMPAKELRRLEAITLAQLGALVDKIA